MGTRVITSRAKARKLIQEGFKVVDIKPDREDESRKSSVFVFERNEKFDKRFDELVKAAN